MGAPKGNQFAKGNKGGRPEKYKKEYCDEIIKFFDIEPNRKEVVAKIKAYNKAGAQNFEKEEYKRVANELPTIYKFAKKIGVSHFTILEWAKRYKEFSKALMTAKELYKQFLIENGLQGIYNPGFAIFVAKNTTDMKDRNETDITSKGERVNTIAELILSLKKNGQESAKTNGSEVGGVEK